jgi:ABC-type phosphate transport system auxiliary subunit
MVKFELIKLDTFQEKNMLSIVDDICTDIAEGNTRPLPAFIQAKALDFISKEIIKRTKDMAIEEAQTFGKDETFNGASFQVKSTGERLNYEDDVVYKELKQQLKEREQLLKDAYKMYKKGQVLVDDRTGELVPVVEIKVESQTTLSVTFKDK